MRLRSVSAAFLITVFANAPESQASDLSTLKTTIEQAGVGLECSEDRLNSVLSYFQILSKGQDFSKSERRSASGVPENTLAAALFLDRSTAFHEVEERIRKGSIRLQSSFRAQNPVEGEEKEAAELLLRSVGLEPTSGNIAQVVRQVGILNVLFSLGMSGRLQEERSCYLPHL